MNVFFERKKRSFNCRKLLLIIFNHFLTYINNWSIWYRERFKEWWQHWSLAARLETYAELHDSRMIGKIHGSGFLNSLLLLWLHMYIEMNQHMESKNQVAFNFPTSYEPRSSVCSMPLGERSRRRARKNRAWKKLMHSVTCIDKLNVACIEYLF